ncbi:MAG: DUF882 domain-containing protein [Candidatus Methanofishera endochildressiae]|uniref:Murein endopeptidase K n=1 Tax=Candidatus Methanofishera endochildressiae TaxID=2738884 RepID=A0A7Z0SE79_9GAMM|nr:DUF882 domain-containing protein [Candidatus Methanofishera endochildressiae]
MYWGLNSLFQVISWISFAKTNTTLHLRKVQVLLLKESLHMRGKAIDICIGNCCCQGDIQKAAMSLARGGVGYYPRSNFVHIILARIFLIPYLCH